LLTNQVIAAHSLRVYQLTQNLLNFLPNNLFTPEQEKDLLSAAAVHDIGKSTWEPTWFTSPRTMISKSDWLIMKAHPVIGARILRESGQYSESVIRIVEQHHERPGGRGYPRKIEPDLSVLILATCDTYAACVESREYRKRNFSQEEALTEVAKFVPMEIVQALCNAINYYPKQESMQQIG